MASTKSKHFKWSISVYSNNYFYKIVILLLLFTDRKQALEKITYPSLYQLVSGLVEVWTLEAQ